MPHFISLTYYFPYSSNNNGLPSNILGNNSRVLSFFSMHEKHRPYFPDNLAELECSKDWNIPIILWELDDLRWGNRAALFFFFFFFFFLRVLSLKDWRKKMK